MTANGGVNTPIPGVFIVAGNMYLTGAKITRGTGSLTINFNKATTSFGFGYFDTDVTDMTESYRINLSGGGFYNSPPFANATNGGGIDLILRSRLDDTVHLGRDHERANRWVHQRGRY